MRGILIRIGIAAAGTVIGGVILELISDIPVFQIVLAVVSAIWGWLLLPVPLLVPLLLGLVLTGSLLLLARAKSRITMIEQRSGEILRDPLEEFRPTELQRKILVILRNEDGNAVHLEDFKRWTRTSRLEVIQALGNLQAMRLVQNDGYTAYTLTSTGLAYVLNNDLDIDENTA